MSGSNLLIFVIYDDVANGILNVQGNVTDLEAFCRAIEQGRIKNVRLDAIDTPHSDDGLDEQPLCPRDGLPCYLNEDPTEAHWRCGTVQCGGE